MQNSHIIKSTYFLLQNDVPPITNKIFELNITPPYEPSNNGTSFFMKNIISFYNIPEAEIQDHLYQPVPPQTQPQP